MAKFQTVLTQARFGYTGISTEGMARIAEAVRAHIHARIQERAENVQDASGAPLSMVYREKWKEGKLQWLGADRGYRARKVRKGTPPFGNRPVRNWTLTGHTMNCLRILTVSTNYAIIGFLPAVSPNRKLSAAQIVTIQNRKERMFGLSPKDRQVFNAAVREEVGATIKAQSNG